MGIFYMPQDGFCGDFIPYYNSKRKTFELYYLHDYRGYNGESEGTPWRRITTTDMVHFNEEGEILPRGNANEQDLFCYTGCVVEHEELYHIFYTGDNYHFQELGKNREAVMHATSMDGINWIKHPEDTFYAPEDIKDIERDDWRDPFVFYNEKEAEWWMLLCTRKKEGPSRRRGATGLLTSDDLIQWRYKDSYWNPHMCWCPECPDLFQWGEYWYFIYSTFCETEGLRTYYRIASSENGPWLNPGNNCFDGRAFYAGKTAADGTNRYIFGWNPTKTGNKDNGVWQWGGNLIVHKLNQEVDGTLTVSMPSEIDTCYGNESAPDLKLLNGQLINKDAMLTLTEHSGFANALIQDVPMKCLLEFDIHISTSSDSAGIMVRADEEGASGYYIRIEPKRGRLVFDREPYHSCEHAEIERFFDINTDQWHSVKVILDHSIALTYFDDKYALSSRMYDFNGKHIMFFVNDGNIQIKNLRLRELKE